MLRKRNHKGFTLIEIIAVLVILGILAAVALPRYFDMAAEARNRAIQGAVAEARGLANLAYARAALAAAGQPTNAQVLTALGTAANALGDFAATAAVAGTTGLTFTVSGTAGNVTGVSTGASWVLP